MNLRKLVVTLTAAALLPTLVHAGNSLDSIHDIYSGYNTGPLTNANATDPLEAYSDLAPAVADTTVRHAVDPQDVWSGAAAYFYESTQLADATDPLEAYSNSISPATSIRQAHAADPYDVYYGSYSYASVKQIGKSDLHDTYYGSSSQL